MNKVILMGRLTAAPEIKTTASGVSVCSFTLAVNRRFKNADGEYEADFIRCTAWRNTAEFVCNFFTKGQMMAVVGELQNQTYEKDGQRRLYTEVVISEACFCGSRTEGNDSTPSNSSNKKKSTASGGGFDVSDIPNLPMPDDIDDDLPF